MQILDVNLKTAGQGPHLKKVKSFCMVYTLNISLHYYLFFSVLQVKTQKTAMRPSLFLWIHFHSVRKWQ